MFAFIPALFFFVLAGRVLAFDTLTVGNNNLALSEIVDIPDSPLKTLCSANCTDTTSRIQACNGDATCLCRADTVAALQSCEQCMFTELVLTNKPMPDFRAGSTPVLSAYSTACGSANITLQATQVALALPPTWDGPFVAVLPFPVAIVTVIIGGGLGVSAILLLSNM
ncbi:hypothetical protein BDN72DRAFT_796211 [Pluteus cervinus]|uniref:Uncharacterized protein n=1 Tax=Pluteus cervinus TaxID=181527 RepID=A0ACD3AVV1_9AGAR|nr:hypothetical protein BDN72DRAFT_796211 [Pluteus cervinus]